MSGSPMRTSTRERGRTERVSVVSMVATVALLNLAGWGILVLVVAPRDYALGSTGTLGVGLGLTVFLLGARHAFDADHIAAIDNTTRMLVEGHRPAAGAGFWFSLGHSSVVFGLALLIALGVRAVAGPVSDSDSGLQQVLGTLGPVTAGTFLLVVGIMNLLVVIATVRAIHQMRSADENNTTIAGEFENRGLLTRLLRRPLRHVTRPWHMYPIGLLMGLGFDTATQVALLVLAAGSAAFTLPWYAVLVLPVLFAAGMTLFDSINGTVMATAYRWATADPTRRAVYNLIVTSLSVLAALGLGTLLLLETATDHLNLAAPRRYLAAIDTEYAGYALAVLLLVVWLTCYAVARHGRGLRRHET